jgi:CheY-like chemotaxis protein
MVQTAEPARLLLVEDDADIILPVQLVLEEEGYVVTTAESLPASLARIEEQVYHLVLTDLFSPVGHDPLQSIRPLLMQAAPTPVAVMTAWQLSREAATQAGVAWMLRKPFDLDDLLGAVQRELRPRRSHALQAHVVEQFFAAISERDWHQVARLCTPQVSARSLSAPAVSVSEATGGLQAYRAFMERRFAALPGYRIDEVRVYRRPVGVAARYLVRWQDRDGVTHRLAGAMHFRFEGERIAQFEGAF